MTPPRPSEGDDPSGPVLAARMAGHWELDDERWRAHEKTHEQMASSLAEYKVLANEFRGALGDLRGTFLTQAEWHAEHRALVTRVEVIEAAVRAEVEQQRGQRSMLSDGRTLLM